MSWKTWTGLALGVVGLLLPGAGAIGGQAAGDFAVEEAQPVAEMVEPLRDVEPAEVAAEAVEEAAVEDVARESEEAEELAGPAEPAGVVVGGPEWAAGLDEALAEGVRILEQVHLAPEKTVARAALLEALLRAAEPGAEFLDAGELAARTRDDAREVWEAGLVLVPTAAGPRVAAVKEKSPAAAAGIAAGETLKRVDSREVAAGVSLQKVRECLARGKDAAVELEVLGADGASRTVTVKRERRAKTSLADVEVLPTGIGYIRVAGMYPGAAAEILAAMDAWAGQRVSGAILDLRGAGGHAEEEVALVAGRFTSKGTLLYTKSDRQGVELAAIKAPKARAEERPLMVLVDACTTGAAELLAAVLGGSARGVMLIGHETSGNPLIRQAVELSNGRHALLATREIRMANGTVYWGAGGVRPDVSISDAALNEVVYEPDEPVLRRGKKGPSELDLEDKALRDRTRYDTYLRRATDLLAGLRALGYGPER
ncbi:MAG: hypothetical protein GX803_05750 [Lentisphaerae bacterium]|jgi:C-terminal peptidase prc|nr:hypothetical protein [Lentisphaerota bacterium]